METELIHPHEPVHHRATPHRLARRALFSFLLTFVISRATVFLIMSGTIPNMYFFLKGTHVHHLNYGIFLLAAVAGYAIFRRPVGRAADITALVYGFALGLTFDEFGMWLHLGGSYWQRASVDAVIVVAALIGLVGFLRSLERFESRHFRAFICLAVVLIGFAVVLYWSGNHLGTLVGPALRDLEMSSSP
jgi:type III secretory pathway component EscS